MLARQVMTELNDWMIDMFTLVWLRLVTGQQHIWRSTGLDEFTQPCFPFTTIWDCQPVFQCLPFWGTDLQAASQRGHETITRLGGGRGPDGLSYHFATQSLGRLRGESSIGT